jgi:hypothetical protein
MAAAEHAHAASLDGKRYVSVTGVAFLGIGSMVGAGIFAATLKAMVDSIR